LPTFSVLDIRLRPDDVSPALQRLGDLFAQRLKGRNGTGRGAWDEGRNGKGRGTR
jgi:hypothetical protein